MLSFIFLTLHIWQNQNVTSPSACIGPPRSKGKLYNFQRCKPRSKSSSSFRDSPVQVFDMSKSCSEDDNMKLIFTSHHAAKVISDNFVPVNVIALSASDRPAKRQLSPKMQNACSSTHTHTTCIRPPRQKAVESKNAKEFEVPQLHLMACANHEVRCSPLRCLRRFCIGGPAPHVVCLPFMHSILPKRGRSTKDCSALLQLLLALRIWNRPPFICHIPLVSLHDFFHDKHQIPSMCSARRLHAHVHALSTNKSQLVAPHMLNSFGNLIGSPNEDRLRTFHHNLRHGFQTKLTSLHKNKVEPTVLAAVCQIKQKTRCHPQDSVGANMNSCYPDLCMHIYLGHIFWRSAWHIFWHSFWHIFWHSFWHLSDVSFAILSDKSFDTLSDDISSDISFWHIFRHSFWPIFWHYFWHIFWHIFLTFLLTYLLTFFLTYLLTFFLTYLLTFFLLYLLGYLPTFFGTYLLTFFLAYLLTFFLTYLLTFFLTFFLTYLAPFFLTYLLTFFLTYLLAFFLTCLLTFFLTYLLTFFLTYLLTFFLTSFWHIFCHSFWHISWHSSWHIFWHSFWHIFWHSFWHIIWHSFWHIFWHIFLTFLLTYLLTWHIFCHSFWHIFWHSFWHIFRHSFWHIFWHSFWHIFLTYLLTFFLTYLLTFLLTYLLTFFLTYLLTFFLTYLLTFFLTYLLTFFLTYLLTFFLTYLSDISFWHIFLTYLSDISFWHSLLTYLSDISSVILSDKFSDTILEVRHATLNSQDRGWGPGRHTELTGSRLGSGPPHWTHRIAVGVRHATLNSQDRGWGPARHTELAGSRLGSGTPHWTHRIAVGARHATRTHSWDPTRRRTTGGGGEGGQERRRRRDWHKTCMKPVANNSIFAIPTGEFTRFLNHQQDDTPKNNQLLHPKVFRSYQPLQN